MPLSNFKVRVLNQQAGTGARVRVLINIESSNFKWGTEGVSYNIIKASWQTLTDGYDYFLYKNIAHQGKLKEISKQQTASFLFGLTPISSAEPF